MRHTQRFRLQQPSMPVDPRPRIPPAVRLPRVVHLHRNHILAAVVQMRRQFVRKRHKTIRTQPQILPVDPHLAVHINAVELQQHHPAAIRRVHTKSLPIPPHTRGQIRAIPTARFVLIKRSLDAPVIRQIDTAPTRSRESRLLRARGIALREPPAGIKTLPRPHPCLYLRRQTLGQAQIRRYRHHSRSHRSLSQHIAPGPSP